MTTNVGMKLDSSLNPSNTLAHNANDGNTPALDANGNTPALNAYEGNSANNGMEPGSSRNPGDTAAHNANIGKKANEGKKLVNLSSHTLDSVESTILKRVSILS